ncbi:MAG TPA: hypothetical protein DC009_08950 [Porphyromonadaceae bacterium]|nr:hypothetical protein [Porphyromonadaceae bacterium]
MATYLECLKGINAYPVPLRTVAEAAERRGLTLSAEASAEGLLGREYRLVRADLLLWLSLAPNISQGGQSFSLSEDQRKALRREAQAAYDELEPGQAAATATFGYKGDRL